MSQKTGGGFPFATRYGGSIKITSDDLNEQDREKLVTRIETEVLESWADFSVDERVEGLSFHARGGGPGAWMLSLWWSGINWIFRGSDEPRLDFLLMVKQLDVEVETVDGSALITYDVTYRLLWHTLVACLLPFVGAYLIFSKVVSEKPLDATDFLGLGIVLVLFLFGVSVQRVHFESYNELLHGLIERAVKASD